MEAAGELFQFLQQRVERMKIQFRSVIQVAFICGFYGCSSAPVAEPKSPPPAPTPAAPTPEAKQAADAPAESAPTSEPDAMAALNEAQGGEVGGDRKASRPPLELITNPTALFVFNFVDSDVGKAAKEKCDAAGGDRKEIAACLQKARDKVPVESLRFVKKNAEYFWVTLNRYKGNLLKWHVIQFQVGEEKGDRLTLKPQGKDKGIAPMPKVPRTLEIELPNDYSIVLNDPEFGKMTFDTKFGKFEE
ncbi:MAG TPA: hypothetical protein VKP30_13295 [Polyangiaceae bacterium]|nr:hypothetical protein [Polyangiaceae bacterium]